MPCRSGYIGFSKELQGSSCMPIGLQAATDLYLDHVSAGECVHLHVLCLLLFSGLRTRHNICSCCSCCWRHWTSSGGHASVISLSEAHVVSPIEDVRGEWFAQACLLMIQCGLHFVIVIPASCVSRHCMWVYFCMFHVTE